MKNILVLLILTFPTFSFAQAAFDFTFTNAEDDVEYTLYEDFLNQGKTIFIDFFHTRCPSCRPYAPLLEPLYQEWGGGENDVEFIAISTQSFDINASVAFYQQDEGHTFLAMGSDGGATPIVERFAEGEYGPFLGTPTFAVIAPNGEVQWRISGSGVQGTVDAIDAAIAATGAIKPNDGSGNGGGEMEEQPVTVSFAGQIRNGENGVSDVEINLAETLSAPILSNNDGSFNFFRSLLPSGEYSLELKKTSTPTTGVSTFDLIKIRKHILGLETFDTPWQFLAADVNGSGTISTADLIRIRKVILGIDADFGNVPNWRFYDAELEDGIPIEFINRVIKTDDALNNLQIRAVKAGDVNFSGK
ncbi:MAG: redoxin family protein [Saprospiraceae bacterium]